MARLFGRKRELTPDTEVLLPVAEPTGPPGRRVLEDDLDVGLVLFENAEGQLVAGAFTSEDALSRWMPQGSPFVGVAFHAAVGFVLQTEAVGLALDLGGPNVIAFTRADLEDLTATMR